MFRVNGSLARKLELAELATEPRPLRPGSARRLLLLRGPDKYRLLDRRRRAAQINARHILDLLDTPHQRERR